MKSTAIQITDAVVTKLNAAPLSLPFTAQRHYVPKFDLEQGELNALQVSVVPKALAVEQASRAGDSFDCSVDIAVQQKVDPNDRDALDALMLLVEQIVDALRRQDLEALPEALWLSLANEPIYAPNFLIEKRVFTSVLTVTYRVVR